jgi:hypothetical protein
VTSTPVSPLALRSIDQVRIVKSDDAGDVQAENLLSRRTR